MPKVTVFAHSVSAHDDSIRIEDAQMGHTVYETTDLLFVNDTAIECSTAIGVLRELATAAFEVIDVLEAKRTALLISQLSPGGIDRFAPGSVVHDPTGRYPDVLVPDRKVGE